MYNRKERKYLREKLDYEMWILSELEEEVGVFPEKLGTTFIVDGEIVESVANASTLVLGQKRVDKIIQRMYPLIFTASFKSLDMMIEWVLQSNSVENAETLGYENKKDELCKRFYDNSHEFLLPPPFQNDKGCFERLIQIFIKLIGHRHAIVHRHEFSLDNGVFSVEDSSGKIYEFNQVQLFSFAMTATTSAEAMLEGAMTEEQERGLKRYLDSLYFIHQLDKFNIAPPWARTIEYEQEAHNQNPYSWEIEKEPIDTADSSTPDMGRYFLKVVGTHKGNKVCTWKIPSEKMPDKETFVLTKDNSEFAEFQI